MANQTVTKTPDQWKNKNTDSWKNSDPSGRRLYFGYDAPDWAAWYRQFLENRFTPVSECSLKVRFLAEEYAEQGSYANVVCTAYGYDENDNLVWQKKQTYYWSMTQTGDHTFTFSDIGGYTINTIVYKITSTSGNGSCTAPTASYTYTPPTLGLSVTPSSLYVGETITCSIQETFGQTFTVRFSYGSTTLQSLSTSEAKFTQTANASWFTAAGVTGNSMQVTVTITDGLGRSASARVTVKKHTALVPSITAPKGGSIDGGQTITFAWSSSGDGYQTKAELQYSRDNVNWSSLTTVSGTGTQWTAPAGKFSAGAVYWRLRLTNNWGLTSGWVSVSFTITINAAVVTLTAPTSGSKDGAAAITFAWTIAGGSGSVNGTQMEYSTDGGITWTSLVNYSGSVTSYNAAAGKFKAGSMTWRVRARDSYAGWGVWKQANITITYTPAVVTLTTPTSGSYDGGQALSFAWTIAAGSGSVNGTQMAYSTDDGINWTNLVNSGGSVTSYKAAAGQLPGGRILWRVRARDSYADWGAWKQASITINYTPAVVTLTTPTSGSYDGGQALSFAWTIAAGSGSVNGTQMAYSTDDGINWTNLVNSGGSVTSYKAAAGQLPGGRILWRVRARDSYADWGAWKQASITINYTPATVTLTTPTSGSWDGAEAITFGWSITKGSGTVNGTQMQISTDDGLTWTDLLDSDKSVTTYSAGVAQFPAGKLLWRVRAKDSYSGYAENWKQATITVTYSAVSQVAAVNSPTSGVYNAAAARTFEVRLDASGPVYAPFQIQAAKFYWRSGETGDFTEIDMTPGGNTASVEIPAGTFPSGRIEWYATATDTTGRTTETPRYVLTALQTDVEAAPLSPVNTIESGSGPTLFRWTYGSLDGSPQGRAQLQYSRDGETWTEEHVFADITGDVTSFLAEQGTFPGGTVFWRVRSYNDAGTAGPWSQAVSFSSYSAPLVTGVTGDGRPFSTITWQADGQEAYEIEVDGKTYGPYYGANVRTFTLPEPLPDGNYTIRVRAQNKMTLWSQWVSGQMSVVNVQEGYPFDFVIDALPGNVYRLMITDESVDVAPTITGQPKDRKGNEESVNGPQTGAVQFGFKVDPQNRGNINIQWYVIANWSTDKTWYEISGKTGYGLSIQAVERLSGNLYRARLWNDAGEIYTRTATFTYGRPDGLDYLTNTIPGIWHADTGFFLVYRDGKLIAKTYSKIFDDRVITGKHTYRIVQALPGGYYRESLINQAEENPVNCPMIAPLEGGDFISLKLSENAEREVRITEAREVEWTQYAGADYPSAEIGEGKSKAVALDVSALMSDEDFAKAFTALLGQDVIVKTPDGTVVIGPLESLDLRAPRSHRSWTFGVTQMEWSDFIDES